MYDLSLEYYQKVLSYQVKKESKPELILTTRYYLGKCHYHLGDYQKGKELLLQVIEGRETIFGKDTEKTKTPKIF